jgi:predicted RNA binding protein YcfA (HicA-like mRNA interferase family)
MMPTLDRRRAKMLTDSRRIIQRLRREGWVLDRVRGSHHVFRDAATGEIVVVAHPRSDIPLKTVKSIYRQAR